MSLQELELVLLPCLVCSFSRIKPTEVAVPVDILHSSVEDIDKLAFPVLPIKHLGEKSLSKKRASFAGQVVSVSAFYL